MLKFLVSILLVFGSTISLANSAEIQSRPPRYDDSLDLAKACADAFPYEYQKSKTYKRGFPETQCLCSQGNYAQTPR